MKKTMLILVALMLACSMTFAAAESTIDVIMNVGTTQAFTDAAVSEEDLNVILQAGLAATSAINQQPWYFVVVTNPDVMAEIGGSGMIGAAPAGDAADSSGEAADSTGEAAESSGETADSTGEAADSAGEAAPAATTGAAKAAVGDSPVAIVIYMNEGTSSPNASFDCGLACQNMVIAAASLGYGAKIVSSPTMTLNGTNHDALCEKLGVDPAYQAVAVLLIGYAAETDAQSSASVRNTVDEKVSFVK